MKRGQALIFAIAIVAVAVVAWLASGGGDDGGGGGRDVPTKAERGGIEVRFVYSPEKEKMLVPLIKEYNAEGREVSGKRVFVRGEVMSSGDSEQKIANGRLKPAAWSPSSSLWGRLLNYEADRPLAPEDSPSIVRTPLVIAMFEPLAKAIGHPRKGIGFEEILELATSNQGFAKFGHPEFGRFKLVHTNPDFSTSGLSAVVAEYYAATGKKEGLTEREVSNSAARRKVRAIERSIVHYGDTTLFIADQLRKEGPGYASAVAMEEVTLLDFNKNRGAQPKLVAIYPKEGTFYSDNPFIVLQGDWVSPNQKKAAEDFREFLDEKIDAEVAARFGFRPADLKTKPAPAISKANGADPTQPKRVLGLPSPRVLNRIKTSWREDRKPANVLLVVDTSGSMNDEGRLPAAKKGLQAFFREVSPADRVGLTIFSDRIQPLQPIRPFRTGEDQLRQIASNLIADGGTAFYDATLEGFEEVRRLRDRDAINAVVLLTDGEDTDSQNSLQSVTEQLRAQGDSPNRVRVYTIAFSAGAEGAAEALKEIAAASGGKDYEGGTGDIESVYRSISSFF